MDQPSRSRRPALLKAEKELETFKLVDFRKVMAEARAAGDQANNPA